MLYNLHPLSSKCRLFRTATLFGFCITHILNTGCAKIWKKKSVAKRLNLISFMMIPSPHALSVAIFTSNFLIISPAKIKLLVWKTTYTSKPSSVLLQINVSTNVNHLRNMSMWTTQCKTSRYHKLLTVCNINWRKFRRTLSPI